MSKNSADLAQMSVEAFALDSGFTLILILLCADVPYGWMIGFCEDILISPSSPNPKVSKSRPDPNDYNVCFRVSRFGPVAIVWSFHGGSPGILRVLLSRPGLSARQTVTQLFSRLTSQSCGAIDRVADQIEAFLRGRDIRFTLDSVRLDLCSEFQQKVLRAEHAIPRGYVSTYQRIARHLEKPSSSRAVGSALARNPFPIIVPCHRAIRSDGRVGGYQGGTGMKRALLEMEGIDTDDTGRILSAKVFY